MLKKYTAAVSILGAVLFSGFLFVQNSKALVPMSSMFGNASVPQAAQSIVDSMDRQIEEHVLKGDSPRDFHIIPTVAVHLNNLDQTSPLAKQMSEEVTTAFAEDGYSIIELRKGTNIEIQPRVGEFILTRDVTNLARNSADATAILAGTYVVSKTDVRFSMSLIDVATHKVVAKASSTVPITQDILPLIGTPGPKKPLMPSVQTKLN